MDTGNRLITWFGLHGILTTLSTIFFVTGPAAYIYRLSRSTLYLIGVPGLVRPGPVEIRKLPHVRTRTSMIDTIMTIDRSLKHEKLNFSK